MKQAKIEAIGVVSNGDVELVLRPNDKHEPVFYRTERMGMEDVVNFISSLISKNENTN